MSKRENKRTEFEKYAPDHVSSFEYGVGQHPFSDCSPYDSEEDADDEVFSICNSIFSFHFPTLLSPRFLCSISKS
jgi:hypothetical protein